EVLRVEHVEPALDRALRLSLEREEPVAREDVLLDEGVAARGLLHLGDAVGQDDPARRAQRLQLVVERVRALLADVAHHSDGDVSLPLHPVVELEVVRRPNLDRELPRAGLLADVFGLVVTEGDPETGDTVLLRGVEHEVAPATSDVEEPLARPEIELP